MKVIWFKDCSYKNKFLVGGKCSSLGELYNLSKDIGFSFADGYAITTTLYDSFIKHNNLGEIIEKKLTSIDVKNIRELEEESKSIRELITNGNFSYEDENEIIENYVILNENCGKYTYIEMNEDYVDNYRLNTNLDVAVRSSAIAEDMANASFAGQQDTYLNISGCNNLLDAVKKCFASLFNARAISYRKEHDIDFSDIKMSVAIQSMVRSDLGSSGVAFSIDPENGNDKIIVINSSFGLGELIVSGGVNPDEFILEKRLLKKCNLDVNTKIDPIISKRKGEKLSKMIYKEGEEGGISEVKNDMEIRKRFSLNEKEIVRLGKYILELEESYSKIVGEETAIDVEWAKNSDGDIFVIQTRPETIHSNKNNKSNKNLTIDNYTLLEDGEIIVKGVAVGEKISSGRVKILESMQNFQSFEKGDILVTDMTTPDWEPLMKIASGIITNKGGRTCHAAIVARELGLNAIVGTGNGTSLLKCCNEVTLSCISGSEGIVYNGILKYKTEKVEIDNNLILPVKLMMNIGNPENAFHNSMMPNNGVGLVRLEFIINNHIKIHPLALCDYPNVVDETLRQNIRENVVSDESYYGSAKLYFVKKLAKGIAKIASSFYPKDVIVRLSDFKSNEYKNLMGGNIYEPNEENPMIGWRGASRYYSKEYERAFELECCALKYARENMMMDNIIIMIPFCRTPEECKLVIDKMESFGLKRGENKLQIYLMCEIPSNVIEADMFSPMIDGVSIGGNDLLQLTLGVDRDSEKITYLSNDNNLSYRRMISMAINSYKERGVKVGFCGQQPSDSTEFCHFLIKEKIDSISVTTDSLLKTLKNIGY